MSNFSPLNYINTGKDGQLDRTTTAEIDAIIAKIGRTKKAVWHFHGGLVSHDNGMTGAQRLYDTCYAATGAHPVFFVWESGLIETVTHNWQEIFDEAFFRRLLDWLVKFAVGKLDQASSKDSGAKGLMVILPKEVPHQLELRKTEPYAEKKPAEGVPSLTEVEKDQLKEAIKKDPVLTSEVLAILETTTPGVAIKTGAKGVEVMARKSTKTLMSPDQLEKLHSGYEVASPEAKGFISVSAMVKVAETAVLILNEVLKRFQEKRDHGVYPTVVEELLREYYLANVGAKVWSMMKKETFDTFQPSSAETVRGGDYFLTKFGELLKTGVRPEITLVGHSTGAVFINNLLRSFAARQASEGWPDDFKFKQIVFLAPACRFDDFVSTATSHRNLFDNFRMFTMNDEKESSDMLLSYAYPRSLLYAISGVLETEIRDGEEASAYDMPIMGMQRYYQKTDVYSTGRFPEIETARQFLAAAQQQVVWSVTLNAGPGLNSQSVHHGDFDNDAVTLESVAFLLTS